MKNWKGIVLAGGTGTRLYPITKATSKQLLPVYDKPMIYYPISVLMLAEIREILIITTPEDQQNYINLLGDGKDFGIKLKYAIQTEPRGIADAFIVGEKFIGQDSVCLILGDNIFYGQGFKDILMQAKRREIVATVFGYHVKDPYRFGVVEFNKQHKAISIKEKPNNPKSNYAVTGLYFYDNQVIDFAKTIEPSNRGELEISTVNQHYLQNNELFVESFGRGFAWLDTGTHEGILEASQFVQVIEQRQGLKIGCLEEIGYRNEWIDSKQILRMATLYNKTVYGSYLASII